MTNRVQDAFHSIKADTGLKESTKKFLNEKYKENIRPRSRSSGVRLAASFACAMFVFMIGAAGYSWVQKPVSYVSIDVNPSIELALNRFDRVVSAAAYNLEGEEVLSGLSLKGKKYTEAIHEVVECESMRTYLSGPAEVVLTVAAEESREEELDKGVQRCAGHMEHGCRNACADIGMVSKAHEWGLSFGKYNAYLKLLAYDSTITAEECKSMSMAQIRERIRQYENGNPEDSGSIGMSENSGGNGNGSGYGGGNGNGNGSGCGNGNGEHGDASSCGKRHRHGNGNK